MKYSPRLDELLRTAESVCVLTGAGVSAESGVATFRGPDGLWAKLKPEELANFDAFLRNPELVWEWYAYRKKVIHEVSPNAAHIALAEMESIVRDFTLVTQNIDNLHLRAGSKRVLELHGNIERSYCTACGRFDNTVTVTEDRRVPRCSQCGGLMRPDVVWFGEMLPQEEFDQAEEAAGRCELFLSIGTSAVVYPAAGIPLRARSSGAYVVEVNTEHTDISPRVNESLVGPAATIVPALLARMKELRKGTP